VRPLVRFNVSVLVEQGGRREQGYAGAGGRYSLAELVAGERPLALAREATRQALVNLEARPAPAGTMTVVLGPGWPGILLHEAIGHGLEGDFNRKGTSHSPAASASRWRRRSARWSMTARSPRGAAHQHRRRRHADPVHHPDRERRAARLHAGPLERPADGRATDRNGRRESFAHMTLPRMTNTYMRPGPHAPEENHSARCSAAFTRSNFGGGQVDITSGKFVFSASEAYAIENGRVARPSRARP